MKLKLQNIQKGSDSISQYLHRIKDVCDHMSVAGVSFEDDDIVILALKCLPSKYNTFRTVIRGRENVISLKDFKAQLLAEEVTIENNQLSSSFVIAMLAKDNDLKGKRLMLEESSFHSNGSSQTSSAQYHHGGFNGLILTTTKPMVLPIILEATWVLLTIEVEHEEETIMVIILESLEIIALAFLDLLIPICPLAQSMGMMFLLARYVTKGVTLLLIAFKGTILQLWHLLPCNVKFAGNLDILQYNVVTRQASPTKEDHHHQH